MSYLDSNYIYDKMNDLSICHNQDNYIINAINTVKKDGLALKNFEHQTDELCLAAVKQNGNALMHVKNQTEEICLEAVKQNGNAWIYVKCLTRKIGNTAIYNNALLIDHIEQRMIGISK